MRFKLSSYVIQAASDLTISPKKQHNPRPFAAVSLLGEARLGSRQVG